jgi:hyaluronoglucosaminidase
MLMAQNGNNGDLAWKERLALEKVFGETEAIPQEVAKGVMKPFLEKAIEMNDEWLGIAKTRPTTTWYWCNSCTINKTY